MSREKVKVYIYTRVSTSMQIDGYSLDAQKSWMKAFCDFNDYEIAGEYEDAGKSGKTIEGRVAFNQMMEDIKTGKSEVSFVLVFKLSRFGRNAADVLASLQVMQDFGVNLICVEDGIDSSKDAGKLMISVLSAVAEIERENIRIQTMEGRIQKAREGKWNGGFEGFSDDLDDGGKGMNNDFGHKVIEKALLFAEHEWFASEKNVMHGIDDNGRFVDTPDVTWKGEELDCGWWMPNQMNKGIPYGWGNASSLEEFDQGIAMGKYAGNVPEDTSRYGSHNCVGVDCSGLLTVCWELPKKIAARDIPGIADVIDVKDIKQGDVFAIRSHVMLFKEFLDEEKSKVRIIDSTRSTGKVSQRDFLLEDLLNQGYLVYRKDR